MQGRRQMVIATWLDADRENWGLPARATVIPDAAALETAVLTSTPFAVSFVEGHVFFTS